MSRRRRELRQLTIDGGYIVEASRDLQNTWGGRRNRAGRPKSRPDTVTISVRVPDTMAGLIRARAASCGQSVSAWLVDLIKFDLRID